MQKIINDPVYGFITISHPLIFDIIAHRYFQRLRRIHQMALAYLVYPGAVHTRLHHALGAYHLMTIALEELKNKGVDITPDEVVAAQAAILLHDVGHGPFSHALEGQLINGMSHEQMSLMMMQQMNQEMDGKLSLAIKIFSNQYEKKFLHQMVSGQIDVDRMDYLNRDSFFTGVSEGVIGYHRILKMLTVHNGTLMIEEKGIYSIEKFLVSRRQMYWQVYLHKTVVSAEVMLVNILKRVRVLNQQHVTGLHTGGVLDYFLFEQQTSTKGEKLVELFYLLDDNDCLFAIKQWARHKDEVLQQLCNRLLNRVLLKIKLQATPFAPSVITEKRLEAQQTLHLGEKEAEYFVFTGVSDNTMYKMNDNNINILFKDGSVRDIAGIDNPLIHQTISATIKKYYLCSLS